MSTNDTQSTSTTEVKRQTDASARTALSTPEKCLFEQSTHSSMTTLRVDSLSDDHPRHHHPRCTYSIPVRTTCPMYNQNKSK